MKEGLARGQFEPHRLILRVTQVQHGVEQKGQQIEHDQHHGQVLTAMAYRADTVVPDRLAG